MELFKFISGDDFRACLESDYAELEKSMEGGCWKAAHVIAGSIVEAVLVDHLVSSDYHGRGGKDPLKMELSAVIDACKEEKILSEKTAGLCTVVRQYRNLIHPGRVIREREKVDEDQAKVARLLVDIVVSEVSEERRAKYGSTAEQITSKIERDPGAVSFLKHLLKKTHSHEIERLLLVTIPNRYTDCDPFADDADVTSRALQRAFRSTFDHAPEETKKRAMKRYVTILEEGDGDVVRQYENAFVRAPDLQHLDDDDLALAKAHLLSRLKNEQDLAMLSVIDGMTLYMTQKDTDELVDPLLRLATAAVKPAVRARAREVLESSYRTTSEEQDGWIADRMQAWVNWFERKGMEEEAKTVGEIRTMFVLKDPFADE